jgi:hypothetical protein
MGLRGEPDLTLLAVAKMFGGVSYALRTGLLGAAVSSREDKVSRNPTNRLRRNGSLEFAQNSEFREFAQNSEFREFAGPPARRPRLWHPRPNPYLCNTIIFRAFRL